MINNNVKYIVFVALLYIAPLALINADYYDDLNRSITGYGWSQDGRFIASFIMSIMSFGTPLLPMAFIVKVISAAIVLISGYIIGACLFDGKKCQGAFFGLFALTSPFYIENLSYTYDSIPMSISILAGILPFLFFKGRAFTPVSLMGLIIVLGTYQASIVIYPIMVICMVFRLYLNERKPSALIHAILPFILMLVAYFIYSLIIHKLDVVPSRAGFLEVGSKTMEVIGWRIKSYEHMFTSLLSSRYLIPITLFIITLVSVSIFYIASSKEHGATDVLIMIACTLLIFSFMFIPNIILKSMFMTPRTMIAYPFAMLPPFILFSKIGGWYLKVVNVVFSLLILYSFMLINVYSRSIKENIETTNFIGDSIYRDISVVANGKFTVAIHGEIKISDRSSFLYREMPFLHYLSPIYAKQGSYWSNLALFRLSRVYPISYGKKQMPACNTAFVNRYGLYSIFKDGNNFDVFLSSKCINN